MAGAAQKVITVNGRFRGLRMRRLSLSAVPADDVDRHQSERASYGRVADLAGEAALGVMRLGPKGRVGRHTAASWQLALVVSGSGRASGADDESVALSPGDAVVWEAGESHETTSDGELVLLIVEADVLKLVSGQHQPA